MSLTSPIPGLPTDPDGRPDLGTLGLAQRAVWVLDTHAGRILHANAAAQALWRADSADELLARDLSRVSPSMRARTEATLVRLARGEAVRERCTFYPRGAPVAVDCLISGLARSDGAVVMLIEATELDVAPDEVRALEALRHTGALITLYDGDGRVLFRNPAALAAYPGDAPPFAARFAEADAADRLWTMARAGTVEETVRVTTARGTRWHALAARATPDPVDGAACVLVSEQDVTAEVEARARIEHMATHDPLTDLANRELLRRGLEAALAAPARQPAALLCLDLDRFKAVNDTRGHAAGDALLRAVADRLRSGAGARSATVARLGGDEFAVLLPDGTGAAALAARLVDAVGQSYALADGAVEIGVSIGVAFAGPDATPDRLMRAADTALYRAKAEGRGTVRVYGAAPEGPDAAGPALRAALARGDLDLHYQPQVAVDGTLIGFEALLRWPGGPALAPATLARAAEVEDLGPALGAWVIGRACADAAAWPAPLRVGVNVSATHLADPAFAIGVLAALNRAALAPARLELEVGEAVLSAAPAEAVAALHGLRGLGVRVAVDDFGAGRSTLSGLRAFAFDAVKIGVGALAGPDGDAAVLVRALLGLSGALGATAVVKGVETPAQLGRLVADGAAQIQGYLTGEAKPLADVHRLLRATTPPTPVRAAPRRD